MRTRSRRRLVTAGVVGACLLAAACSEDRDPLSAPALPVAPTAPPATAAPATTPSGTDAAIGTEPGGTESGGTDATGTDATGTETAGTDAAATETTAAAVPTGPTFGDMPWPCGPGEVPNTDDGSVPGVTADEIVIAVGDDAGFSLIPGLNHEVTDATVAMVAECNSLGGINGRTIRTNYYDTKLTEVASAILRACGEGNFVIIGEGWAFDEQQEEIRQSCGLPAFPAYSASGAFSHAPMMYQASPNPFDEQTGAGLALLAQQFPAEVQQAGALSINIGAVIGARDKIVSISPDFGWDFLTTDILSNPMGETDWTPFVDQLQSQGVEAIYFGGQCFPMLGEFFRTARINDYEPIMISAPNMYEPRCADDNADGAIDNLYFFMDYVPMFEAEHNKATQDYLDVMEEHGGDTALLGMAASSSFLLWAQAADACGATLTRECVLENASTVTAWTGGGLHAVTNPGENHPSGCGALFKFSGTEFERVLPAEPASYVCDDSFVAPVNIPAMVDPLLLDENRVSRIYTEE